ncbi:AAA family ATPase, partial [Faecalicatena contorta]|uniref:AAA family ATPase n=2 Tax=Bacillati TaxID=1783272 RepID=UPI001FAF6B13
MAERDRLILVIDEYPYLAKAEPMVSSLLQQLIDQHHGTGKLMLILSGSSMSFMERQVLGYQSPLYGRRTAQIKVMPFDYRESRGFVPDMGKEDAAVVYGITGGIPQYLIQFDDGVSLEENLRWNVLDPSTYLFEEPGKLLQEELRKPAEYNNIIQTIASGASSGVKIANGSHIEQTVLSHYLRNLSDLHIIVKETPYPEGSRRGIWRIEDLLFRFWYRYIPDNMSLIESG